MGGLAFWFLDVNAALPVGNDARMPDFVVMLTTLGGMAVFGINGFVIGSAIAAMFIPVWRLYSTVRPDAAAAPR